jgi:hypothetical protein
MSRRLDGGSNDTAIRHVVSAQAEVPARPAPEENGRA